MSYHREVILSKWEITHIQIALAVYARELDINSEKYRDIMKLSDELDRDLEMFCSDCAIADEELNEDNICYTCELKRSGKEDY